MPTPLTRLPLNRTPLLGQRIWEGAGVALLVVGTAVLLPVAPAHAATVPASPAFTQTSAQTVAASFMAQVADMNEDGRPDIVSSQLSGPQGFAIELGNGNGTFGAPLVTAVAKQHGVSVGDVNSDGHQDVVTRSNSAGTIQVFFGTGTGAVTAGPVHTIPPRSDGVGASGVYTVTLLKDFDNDGKLDLAVPLYYQTVTGYFTILKGDGLGGFANTNTNFNISFSYALGAADLNGDGYADLVAVDDYLRQLMVYLSDGTGGFRFRAPVLFPFNSSTISALAVGDVNNDGKPDLATASSLGLIAYLNDGSGGLTPTTIVGGGRYNVAIADFNGDGFADLASGNTSTFNEEFSLGSATGAFTLGSASYNVGTTARTARAADFNGDGRPDLHVSAYGTNLSRVLTYQGLVGAPAVTTHPSNRTVTAGQTAAFTAAASGTPTVQWQRSADSGATWNDIAGAVSTTYTTGVTSADDDGARFRAVFTNAVSTATTTAATLTVLAAPAFTTQPADATVDAGDSVSLTAAASGNPTPSLQWQRSTDAGTSFTSIVGETGGTLSFTAASGDSGDQYRVVATNSAGSATSDPATLTVISPPLVTAQPADQTVASGQDASFTATAGGSASTVQWQQRADATSAWTPLAGQTGGTLTVTTTYADSGRQYRAVFSNSAGTAASDPATLTVSSAAPGVTDEPGDQTVQSGQDATFTAASSGDPTPTVQWQRSTDAGASFADLPGETGVTLTVTTAYADDGFSYRALFTNAGGTATTRAALLTVAATSPLVTAQPGDETVTAGQTASFSAASSGDPTPTVQWQRSTDRGVSFTDLVGETGTTLALIATSSDDGSFYRAVFTNPGGAVTTEAARLTVITPVGPGLNPPTAPRDVRVTQTGPGQVTITWVEPADAGSSAVTGYDVGYGNGGSGNGTTVAGTTRRAVFDGLGNGSYQASVAATNAAGTGPRVRVAFTVEDLEPPDGTEQAGELPWTGGGAAAQLEWALGLTALGGVLLGLSRRRRSLV